MKNALIITSAIMIAGCTATPPEPPKVEGDYRPVNRITNRTKQKTNNQTQYAPINSVAPVSTPTKPVIQNPVAIQKPMNEIVDVKAISTIAAIAPLTGLTIIGNQPESTVSIAKTFDPYQALRDIAKKANFGLMLDRQTGVLTLSDKLTDKAGNPINQLVLVDDGANALAISAANPDTIKNAKLNVLPPPDAVTEVNLLTALEMLKPTDWRVANPFGYSTDIMLNMPHGKPLTQTLADTIRQTPYKLKMDFDAKQLVITDAKNFMPQPAAAKQ